MFKKIIFFLILPISVYAADECIQYKQMPDVEIKNPRYKKNVIQPNEPMNKFHGTVLATLVEDYDIVVDIIAKSIGYCVVLKKIDASIGYSDFLIKIDKSHKYNSCSYNAILNHEYKHINAYLSVTDDLNFDIKSSVFNASDSIMPVFVKDSNDIDFVIENMNNEIRNHPEIILIKQKINAAQEIRNKRVDLDEDNIELKSCFIDD